MSAPEPIRASDGDSVRPVAIVTGSSSGIGRACALELARTGWNLVLHGLEQGDELESAAAAARLAGATVSSVTGDIRDAAVAVALVDEAGRAFGRIDGIVSNAGAGLTRDFLDIDDDDWASLLAMHLVAATRILRHAHPYLLASRGAVVTMSSLAATVGIPGRVGYGAAKAGLEGLTMQLAAEWAPQGIRVNGIAPGTILTPLVQRNFALGLLDEKAVLQRTPMARLGRPEEIATVARFLLSADSSYITGQTIRVDGGWSNWGGWS
jgi:NAD(P)-dependent dehydrogenase (short-subunit alcohol dehydrogenase family)